MKKAFHIIALCVLVASMSGCASTGDYFADRGRDAADVFTVAVGYGAGAKARVSFLNLGLICDREVGGLRGGGLYWQGRSENRAGDIQLLIMGGESFDIERSPDKYPQEERGKTFSTPNLIVTMPVGDSSSHINSPAYLTQVEVVAGLGPTVRLGFNPGELLDFILGWTTIDIFRDDVHSMPVERKSQDQLSLEERQQLRDKHLKETGQH